MSKQVKIVEMGPRDGLQNEKQIIPTAAKIELINLLSACGYEKIEATSFVSPKWVPQLADAAQVMAGITRKKGVKYTALTPNMRGYEGARAAGADEVAIFGSASEGFSQANINCSVDEAFARFEPVIAQAKADGIPVRGYVSCVIACPYDGPTPAEQVAKVTRQLLDMGCYEISLGDTIGAGTPATTESMLKAVLKTCDAAQLAGHFHDTGDRALANVEASLNLGLRTYDAAISGLGGCPYAPGAKGNVSSLSLLDLFDRLGYSCDLDRDSMRRAEEYTNKLQDREFEL
ncbi:hydroxymethylglutaryl-CoA lyase [Polycladidibacter hongkongensis]|uniref:hydroxymethylglutaryl-CoA lyase n=1 Tax=Polycladidibacter hongkongensis TaxID=1647556 RepID=UPI00083690F7|nr:hydroxymethylglutaryl-CoA lyase [Pseudovibrio hongkongensis]